LRTSEFEYRLPPELIAQQPVARRDGSRLLVIERGAGSFQDRRFEDLPELLAAGDLLVLNDTRVFPARLHGLREATGGRVEVLFLRPESGDAWLALTRSGGRLLAGERLVLADGRLRVRLLQRRGTAGEVVGLPPGTDLPAFLEEHGEVPLPPYIRREAAAPRDPDRRRYQTVYARVPGAVAAPTAGLHFTEKLLERLARRAVERTALTLHVGPGTFRPVKTERVEEHRMEAEQFSLGANAAAKINAARAAGNRCVAVGTTATRTLETLAAADGSVRPASGWSDLFIRPSYRFRCVDALLTNFHLPRSTLLMLVCALAGRELVMEAYRHAVRERYRFYSYGDACLIL
jgi:S-adenosylmethionine:tRNA ribosyltransferase-isomerase